MDSTHHRPRNYGEQTDRRFEVAQDALTDRIAFARGLAGRRVSALVARSFSRIAGPDEDQELLDEVQGETERLTALLPDLLPQCEPFYATSEVCALLENARETLPKFELRESDLLIPNGFVWLEEPLRNFWEEDPPDQPRNSLDGFAWFAEQNGNACATMYPHRSRMGYPCGIVFPGRGELADFEFPIARLLVAFWLLANQDLLVSRPSEVSRPVRRRAAAQEIKTVTVVTLRRRVYPETTGTQRVEWTHRWLVRGFWRNQWYPSEQRHKPKWIADHVKGPMDKPFVAKQRAWEFTR